MTESTWEDLSSTQRDTLLATARLDCKDITPTEAMLDRLVDGPTEVEQALKGLVGTTLTVADSQRQTYRLTQHGKTLLRQHHARLSSLIGHRSSEATVSVPYCPRCHTPITLLSSGEDTAVRATPCGCLLTIDTDRDPLHDTLHHALKLTDDPDARTHLRQALQLAIARGEQ